MDRAPFWENTVWDSIFHFREKGKRLRSAQLHEPKTEHWTISSKLLSYSFYQADMLPKSIKIKNFRSIGSRGFYLSDLNKVNIIIGRNNSGKSNILKSLVHIKRMLEVSRGPKFVNIDRLDFHRKNESDLFTFEIEVDIPKSTFLSLISQSTNQKTIKFTFEASDSLKVKNCSYYIGGAGNTQIDRIIFDAAHHYYYELDRRMTQPTYEDISKAWNDKIFSVYFEIVKNSISEINIIPEFRQISIGESYNFDGKNLIETLAKFKDPLPGDDADIEKFELIQSFVRRLLHLDSRASLSITRDDPTIMIQNSDLRLPLSHYGTGVHQIVILLTAILSKSGEIFCIEEPEIHLHPQLQREFINFLIDNTDNKYIITTHSPSLINMRTHSASLIEKKISTYFLDRDDNSSFGGQIINDTQTLQALNHMGVRASDLLQTNSIIWVEGPSDRIYIRHWLELIGKDVKEGIDYQFAYYGGRVLSGFEVKRDSEEIDDLVNILKINQNSTVVIDSDRKKLSDRINQTKSRIKRECEDLDLHCWVTSGREIENYIPPEVIEKTYLGGKLGFLKFERFDKIEDRIREALSKASLKDFDYSRKKTRYAKEMIANFEKKHMSEDLFKHIEKIYQNILRVSRY